MRVSKILRKKIEKEISNLGYLKPVYEESIINIDKSLFLCEIKMVNDIKSETIKYMQVWDNKKKEFIFTKEWFFATGIPAHKDLKFKSYSLLYFFFVGNEYLCYDANNREFVFSLSDKTIISIKELHSVYSNPGKFIVLEEEHSEIKILFDTNKIEVLYQTNSEDIQYIILNKYVVLFSIGSEMYSLLDFKSLHHIDHSFDSISNPNLIKKDNCHILQFENDFILIKEGFNISTDNLYLGEFKDFLYDKFIVWKDLEYKDVYIKNISTLERLKLFNNEEGNNLTISTIPLDYDVLVKIPDTSDSIIVQHSALPYRIFILMDKNKIIKRIVKLDL